MAPRAAQPVCRLGPLPRPGRALQASYAADVRALDTERRRLAVAFGRARTPAARAAVLARARGVFENGLLLRLAPHWCGTPWAFHGTSQAPRQGHIACGYFVTTLLAHAGLRVARTALAQRSSEAIIKSLTSSRGIRRFSDVPVTRFAAQVRGGGDGLAIVGLDNHVGFLRIARGRVTFLHASYLSPVRVTEEPAEASEALATSRYRVVGRISADAALLTAWLLGTPLPTR